MQLNNLNSSKLKELDKGKFSLIKYGKTFVFEPMLPFDSRLANNLNALIYKELAENPRGIKYFDDIIKKIMSNSSTLSAQEFEMLEQTKWQRKAMATIDHERKVFPYNFVLPEAFAMDEAHGLGITRPFTSGVSLQSILDDSSIDISHEEKIGLLKRVGLFLESLNQVYTKVPGFALNDFKAKNIVVTRNGKDYFDAQISYTGVITSSVQNRHVTSKFFEAGKLGKTLFSQDDKMLGKIPSSKKTDIISYIFMILSYLADKDITELTEERFSDYLWQLEDWGVGEDIMKVFYGLTKKNVEIINPYEKLDSISNGQRLIHWRYYD